jgi:hypothetical protein
MKINLRLHFALLVVVAFVCNAVAGDTPAELHIGISPFLKEGQRQAITRLLPDMVVNPSRLPGGTRVVVWDAWRLVIIADFVIPTLKFDSAQARAPQLAKPLALVGQWMRAPARAEVGVPVDSGAIKAPEWLYEASTNSSAVTRSFVLLGSPIYRSPAEPAFDMGGNDDERYPSDGHLALSLRESVFGCAEKPGRLAHATVHWHFLIPPRMKATNMPLPGGGRCLSKKNKAARSLPSARICRRRFHGHSNLDFLLCCAQKSILWTRSP